MTSINGRVPQGPVKASTGAASAPRMPVAGSQDLWLLDVRELEGATPGTADLSAEERHRMASLIRAEDRLRYAAAHLALRRLLGACLEVPPASLVFTREPCPCCSAPHGGPSLARRPLPLHFSLSHGGDLVLIGMASVPVGVDVEATPDPGAALELANVLHPAERVEVLATARAERSQHFARLWTRKEAYLKGLGTGLGCDPAADRRPGVRPAAGCPRRSRRQSGRSPRGSSRRPERQGLSSPGFRGQPSCHRRNSLSCGNLTDVVWISRADA